MALITCPECGGQLSDKATVCVHCGFPIGNAESGTDEIDILLNDLNSILNENANSEQLYKLHFKGFSSKAAYDRNRIKASSLVASVLNRNRPEADSVNCNSKCIVFDGLTESNALKIQAKLKQLGCITLVSESETTEPSRANKKIEMLENNDGVLKCPRCKSAAITTGQRGYSLVYGFIGSGKTMNRCGNCGYKWIPG